MEWGFGRVYGTFPGFRRWVDSGAGAKAVPEGVRVVAAGQHPNPVVEAVRRIWKTDREGVMPPAFVGELRRRSAELFRTPRKLQHCAPLLAHTCGDGGTHPRRPAPAALDGALARLAPGQLRGLRILVSTTFHQKNPAKAEYFVAKLREAEALCAAGAEVTFMVDAAYEWNRRPAEDYPALARPFLSVPCGAGGRRLRVDIKDDYPVELGYGLVRQYHYRWLRERDRHDWFCYVEEDIRLPVGLVAALAGETNYLAGSGFAPGAVRFELGSDGVRYLTDYGTCCPPTVRQLWLIGGQIYLEPKNKYGGIVMLPRAELAKILEEQQVPLNATDPTFDSKGTRWCLDTNMESASQVWPWFSPVKWYDWCECGLKKVVPLATLPRFLADHFSYKVRTKSRFASWRLAPLDGLLSCLGMRLAKGPDGGEVVEPREGEQKRWSFRENGLVESNSFPAMIVFSDGDPTHKMPKYIGRHGEVPLPLNWSNWRDGGGSPCREWWAAP